METKSINISPHIANSLLINILDDSIHKATTYAKLAQNG